MAPITSPHNPLVKYVRSLERARTRHEEGVYLAEGVRLVGEAVATGQEAPIVLYNPERLEGTEAGRGLLEVLPGWGRRVYEVDERVLAAAAQTETPAGVLAVLELPEQDPLAVHAQDRFGVLLDGVADPGNAGTILRTSAAAGVDFVVALPGSVDLFSPKVVRAGMGAHFVLPLYQHVSWDEVERDLPDRALVVTDVGAGQNLFEFTWPPRTSLVVGSEARGISAAAESHVAGRVHIPMRPGIESLNVGAATSIIIYTALGPTLGRPR
ncbi:MAG TPA: RNA methyltransferase [Chloroflexota bacterium]|nr:RNA methyltransferase [Chloroflexota bacterium]